MSSIYSESETQEVIPRVYVEYLYEGYFSYESFLDKVVTVLQECIESPGLEESVDDSDTFIEDELDYSYELMEMLDRMGLEKYDGLFGVNIEMDCTYIEAISASYDFFGRLVYSRYPVNVMATIRIKPENEDTD